MRNKRIANIFASIAIGSIMLCNTSTSIFAESVVENSYGYSIKMVDGAKVLVDGQNNVKYYESFNADGSPLPLEEFMQGLIEGKKTEERMNVTSQSKIGNLISIQADATVLFLNKQEWNDLQTPRKVSPDVRCDTSALPCPVTATESLTSIESFSTGLTAGDKTYVKANASFTWSTSSTSAVAITLYVRKGEKGYMTFAPRYDFVKGDLHYTLCQPVVGCQFWENLAQWGATPRKLVNGVTDGAYAIAYFL